MANDEDGITLAIPERRPRALKDIGYNSLIYDTSNTSSGEDLSDIERVPSQDARRVLDVSPSAREGCCDRSGGRILW
jgi:hypothetical protein